MSAEQRRLALALLRVEQLAGRLPQGARHHGAAGRAAAHEHGHRRSVRPRPLLRLGLRHARRRGVGLAARGPPPLQALHRRRGHAGRRAVLPRRLADPRGQRVPLGRARLPDDAARGGRRPRDRALARRTAPAAGRVLGGVADRPRHPERRPREPARPRGRAHGRPPVRGADDGCSRSCAPTSRTTQRRWRATRSRASSERASARTRFGWAGSTRPGVPHYYRLQGPTFLLEFDNSRNSGTHIHSVWRDFERDFGRHLL